MSRVGLRQLYPGSTSNGEVVAARGAGHTDRVAEDVSERLRWLESGVFYADAYSNGFVGAVAAAIAAGGAQVKLSADTDYNLSDVANAISITMPVTIVGCGDTTRLVGDGNETHDLFDVRAKLTIRDLTILDHGGRVVDMTHTAAAIDGLHLSKVRFDTCGGQLSGEDAIIHDGGNSYGIKRSTIHHCVFDSCHGGIRLRSDTINKIFAHHNIFENLTASAISIGDNGGVDAHADVMVHDNIIDGVVQAASVETHGIIVLARNAKVHDNVIKDVGNSGGGDDEALYVKAVYSHVHDNTIIIDSVVPTTVNGPITIKGDARGASGATDVLGHDVNVHDNKVVNMTSSLIETAIGIFREGVWCHHNQVIGKYTNGIQIQENDEISDVVIDTNYIYQVYNAGIRARGTAGNISIINNVISGAHADAAASTVYGIYVSNTLASAGAEGYIIDGNKITGLNSANNSFGIYFNLAYTITDVSICDNRVRGVHNPIHHGSSAAYATDVLIANNTLRDYASGDRWTLRRWGNCNGVVDIRDNTVFSPRLDDVLTWTNTGSTSVSAAVSVNGMFRSNPDSALTILDFTGRSVGDVITVYAANANTTISDGGTIVTKSGSDVIMASGDIFRAILVADGGDGTWHEI